MTAGLAAAAPEAGGLLALAVVLAGWTWWRLRRTYPTPRPSDPFPAPPGGPQTAHRRPRRVVTGC